MIIGLCVVFGVSLYSCSGQSCSAYDPHDLFSMPLERLMQIQINA